MVFKIIPLDLDSHLNALQAMIFSPRSAVAYVTIVIFLLYFLSSGIDNSFKSDVKGFFTSSGACSLSSTRRLIV